MGQVGSLCLILVQQAGLWSKTGFGSSSRKDFGGRKIFVTGAPEKLVGSQENSCAHIQPKCASLYLSLLGSTRIKFVLRLYSGIPHLQVTGFLPFGESIFNTSNHQDLKFHLSLTPKTPELISEEKRIHRAQPYSNTVALHILKCPSNLAFFCQSQHITHNPCHIYPCRSLCWSLFLSYLLFVHFPRFSFCFSLILQGQRYTLTMQDRKSVV